MLKAFEINGKPRHTIEKINFSIKGVPYLITETENPNFEPAFHVVKNLNKIPELTFVCRISAGAYTVMVCEKLIDEAVECFYIATHPAIFIYNCPIHQIVTVHNLAPIFKWCPAV